MTKVTDGMCLSQTTEISRDSADCQVQFDQGVASSAPPLLSGVGLAWLGSPQGGKMAPVVTHLLYLLPRRKKVIK